MEKKEGKIKCPYCRKEISINAKECSHCGKSLKVNNIVAGVILGIVVIVAIITIVIGGNVGNDNSTLLKEIETKIGIDSKKAKDINNIFTNIGLNNFSTITHDEILDDGEGDNTTGYRIKTSFSNNIILYLDSSKIVVTIRWADKDFYKNGKALLNFNDYIMTFDEQSNYNIDAQDRIKKLLKSPSTAKFPSITKWSFNKDNGVVTLQSYVDSENSFGAMIRASFQIKYAKDGTIVSLILDSKEYIK